MQITYFGTRAATYINLVKKKVQISYQATNLYSSQNPLKIPSCSGMSSLFSPHKTKSQPKPQSSQSPPPNISNPFYHWAHIHQIIT